MCTGQLINLMFAFNDRTVSERGCQNLFDVFKQDAGRKKTMKEKEACDPRGISLVTSHFSAVFFFFFYCIPCSRSRFPQDLTAWLRGLLYTGSGPVSCFQPR